MCHMLLFGKSKDIQFEHFFDVLFELFSNFHLPLTIKDRGLIFLNEETLKSRNKDMYHTSLSQL